MVAQTLLILNRLSIVGDRGDNARESCTWFFSVKRRLVWTSTVSLAAVATATARHVVALSKLERGATFGERRARTALPALKVASLHLLPAPTRKKSHAVEGPVAVLRTAGRIVTFDSQVEFFQLVHQLTDARRAKSVTDIAWLPLPYMLGRSLRAIAHDQVNTRKTLALISNYCCDGNCDTEHLCRAALTGTFDTLKIEADVARWREAAEVQPALMESCTLKLSDPMRDYPVTAQLADLKGLGNTSGNQLLLGLVFACVLKNDDGVSGCYLMMPVHCFVKGDAQ